MSTNRDDKARIRATIDDWRRAIRTKDADGVIRHYAPDAVSFDLAPPLKTAAGDREGLEAWFETWKGPIEIEVTELEIDASGDLAFARSLNRMSGTKVDGERPNVWFRATVCFKRTDGEWKVVHDHSSVPFYMDGSLKAAVDLEP